MTSQLELCIPPRDANEVLRERLAEAVEAFNACEGDSTRRVELHAEMTRLRRLLAPPGKAGPTRG